jgi:hypothetical protein
MSTPLQSGRQRHVQDIRLRGINRVGLARGQFRRNQVLFNGVGVNPVVDLGQIASARGAFVKDALQLQ